MTPKEKAKAAKRREYHRKWYAKQKAKKSSPKIETPIEPESNVDFIHIINAYYVLRSASNDGQVIADLNKVLSSIIGKQ